MEIMNSGINGKIKFFCIAIILALPLMASGVRLDMHLDQNRFLDNEGNTIHHFNYKIPYYQLEFSEIEDGFVATVDVQISIEGEDGEKSLLNEFPHLIGVRNRETASSRTQYYLDKIILTLSEEQTGIKLYIDFTDRTSGNSYHWAETLENLPEDSLMSDLEFSHRIVREEPRAGYEKFRRGDYQFYVDPTHVYQRVLNDTLCFYYEVQNLYPAVDGYTYITETIEIFNDDYRTEIVNNIRGGEMTTLDMIKRIPADTLETGYYQIEVTVQDRVSNETGVARDYFVIADRALAVRRLFPDIEDEYHLMRYFLPSSRLRNWDTFSDEAKKHFIDRFWTLNDPNPHTEENEFMNIVRERIQHANRHFTHFRDGWETDMGRIYIRNGEPTETDRSLTDIDTKLTRKEYQVWRYRDLNRVYLFIDIQGNGNFRLIYSRNDDMEHTSADWQRFVGEDFDMSVLQ